MEAQTIFQLAKNTLKSLDLDNLEINDDVNKQNFTTIGLKHLKTLKIRILDNTGFGKDLVIPNKFVNNFRNLDCLQFSLERQKDLDLLERLTTLSAKTLRSLILKFDYGMSINKNLEFLKKK